MEVGSVCRPYSKDAIAMSHLEGMVEVVVLPRCLKLLGLNPWGMWAARLSVCTMTASSNASYLLFSAQTFRLWAWLYKFWTSLSVVLYKWLAKKAHHLTRRTEPSFSNVSATKLQKILIWLESFENASSVCEVDPPKNSVKLIPTLMRRKHGVFTMPSYSTDIAMHGAIQSTFNGGIYILDC